MADSPELEAEGVVRVTVFSEGSAVPDTVQIISITVACAINQVPTARLVIADGDMPSQQFPVSDSEAFKPGAATKISAGCGDAEATLFEGIVLKHALQIRGENDARLVVECSDKAVRMTVGRKNANHVDTLDSDVISALIASTGLTADVQATAVQHKALVQYHCTDWDFMLARAEANGLLVIATNGTVAVKAPAASAEPALKVAYGQGLMEFHAELDAPSQSASAPTSQQALTEWAKAQQLESGLARVRGRMSFRGSAKAVVGGIIELGGVGKRFSGKVFVSGVTHTIADGDWLTEVRFGLSPQWFTEQPGVTAPGAAGLLPAVEGLQIGVVMKLDGDPEGEQRIQVAVPVMQAEAEGVWARVVQWHASNGFGSFFLPEVGDEVVLGYFDNDPSHPVILGSLYSSKQAPPYAMAAGNNTKAIVTRCGSKIEFDDDRKRITITTPGNNKVLISDDGKSILLHDQDDNKVELNPGGITLDAVGGVSLSSKADVNIAGLNIRCEAQVGLAGKGTASAELSAAGQTTVKGAMVSIN